MSWQFSEQSYANLVGVRPELVSVATLALARSPIDFGIIDGVRTPEEQAEYVARGVSWTMQSKHLDGLAIDVMAYFNDKGRWEYGLYEQIAVAFKAAAADAGVAIVWGGDWEQKDGGHYELA
jgi:peptidoglycan L-alanyl-D-glutamate endopeptidase CwlK